MPLPAATVLSTAFNANSSAFLAAILAFAWASYFAFSFA
jgi:hypothetical protein